MGKFLCLFFNETDPLIPQLQFHIIRNNAYTYLLCSHSSCLIKNMIHERFAKTFPPALW